MSGYIKLYRGWEDSSHFSEEPYCERAAWCWLLTNAAWKDTAQRNHKGEVVPVKRGQFRTSLRMLATEWKWSTKRVQNFLKALEKCGSVETQWVRTGTLVTICKYEDYQGLGNSRETLEETQTTTIGKHWGNTKEEGKEDKEDKKKEDSFFEGATENFSEKNLDAEIFREGERLFGVERGKTIIGMWLKRGYKPEQIYDALIAVVEKGIEPKNRMGYARRVLEGNGGTRKGNDDGGASLKPWN